MTDLDGIDVRAAKDRRFLPELAALRAFGIAAVLLFHLWPTRLPGGFIGVDVLFVVSGYLISDLIVRELHRTDRLRIRHFFGRRFARLAPSALLVVVATCLAVLIFLPRTQWLESAYQAVASALYSENWYLVFRSDSYVAANAGPTMLQHYWSLGVEAQLYLIWPFLVLTGGWIATRLASRLSWIWRARITLAAAGLASFACSILLRNAGGGSFFSTATRGWEFAAGGLLALGFPALPRLARLLLGVLGWIGLITSVALITSTDHFPGAVALLPVLATAAVVVGGELLPYRLSIVGFIASISYSLYLWHWPVIVLWPTLTRHPMTWSDRIAAGAVSIGLAWLSTFIVERRFWTPLSETPQIRKRRIIAAFAFAAVALLGVASLTSAQIWTVRTDQTAAVRALQAIATQQGDCLGAAAMGRAGCPKWSPA